MQTTCPPEILALAHRLADAAGAAIRPHFRQQFAIEDKDDQSPVTVADRAAEAAMRAMLEAERPADGIQGEEYGTKDGDADLLWVLDPIDGTRSFMAGRPIFGTLIGLFQGDRPILGIVDQPIAGDRWVGAAGQGTTLNGAPVRTRACPALNAAVFGATGPEFTSGRLSASAKGRLWGGDCYLYASVASGFVDVVAELGLKLHDHAALVPVIEGAGGIVTDWQGRPLGRRSPADVLAAGDRRVHSEALALLQTADIP